MAPGMEVIMEHFLNEKDWIEFGCTVEKVTARAVLLKYWETGYPSHNAHEATHWVPKSCFREFEAHNMTYHQVKKWFARKELGRFC